MLADKTELSENPEPKIPLRFTSRRIFLYGWIIALIWTAVIASSGVWGVFRMVKNTDEMAIIQARSAFNKDIMYRRWNAARGGVYGKMDENVPPNPHLKNIPDRDIETPSGKDLTMINPAYMTRQIYEFYKSEYGIIGHITSLNPIRPENEADEWEKMVLKKFEKGLREYSSVEIINADEYMKYMGALITEDVCLKCHAFQNYKVGDIRGGISISIPMEPLRAIAKTNIEKMILTYVIIWLFGSLGILLFTHRLFKMEIIKENVEQERQKLILNLKNALKEIKTLHGIIPICAWCKNVRDDQGYWKQVEVYIRDHSDVHFSHGICPDCIKKLESKNVD